MDKKKSNNQQKSNFSDVNAKKESSFNSSKLKDDSSLVALTNQPITNNKQESSFNSNELKDDSCLVVLPIQTNSETNDVLPTQTDPETEDILPGETDPETKKASVELANHSSAKSKKPPIKRSTMVAVGASITTVLLAAIITIVILAVEFSSVMTTVFYTNFGDVGSVSRNNIFIASVNGEYSLYEGDNVVSGKYSSLDWSDNLNGYIYTKVNGESGALDYLGKQIYSVKADNFAFNITKAIALTPFSATYSSGGTYKTVDFASGEIVKALDGLTTVANSSGEYFTALNGGYVILRANSSEPYTISGSLVGSTATFTVTGQSSSGANLEAISKDSAIISFANTSVIFGQQSQVTGEYYSVYAKDRQSGKSTNFNIVGQNVYYSDLTFTNFTSATRVYAINGMVQIGADIYDFDGEKLTLYKQNALLVVAEKPTEVYYVSGGALYSGADKQLYKAKNPAKFEYLGNDIVLDGSTAQTIDGKKKVENVVSYTHLLGEDVVFTCADSNLYTINGVMYTAKAASVLGAPTKVMQTNGGYYVIAPRGVYISNSDTILLNSVYSGGVHIIGDDKIINHIAAFASNKIEIYTINRLKIDLTGEYFYPNAKLVTNDKFGIVYQSGYKQGIIDLNANLLNPQYTSVILQKDYMVVRLGERLESAYAVCSLSGRLQTGFDYIAAATYGEYIAVIKTNRQACIINSNGKEVYSNIRGITDMKALEYDGEEWKNSTKYGYSYFLSSKGYKVIKYNLQAVKGETGGI